MTSQSASPSESPYEYVTPESVLWMFSTMTPVWTSMPWRLKTRAATLEMSASSVGRTRSIASSSVTSEPSRT